MLQLIARLIPLRLHRLLYRMAHRLRTGFLRVAGGEVQGSAVIARDGKGHVLLVRHSYGSGLWAFPAGGIRRGEDPRVAAMREFAEELGAGLEDLVLLGVTVEDYHGARNVAHVFTGLIVGEPRPDGREIVEARFFAPDDLPPDRSATVARRLALLEARAA
ncbi:MAG: NUDIX domain-containing protein [Alteraurantiacibacter sp.]|nr:NUDIX domain-containing protein [Alteraurantiacibacter sp.]